MADNHQVELLLRDLGKLVGIDALGLDENGRCALVVDGDLEIEISIADGGSGLVLAGFIGKLPADAPRELYADLLEANFFWRGTAGATLGIERDSASVVMVECLPVQGLHVSQLEQRLAAFVESARSWTTKITANRSGGSDVDAAARAGDVVLPA